jgi:hypothetical protein
MEYVIITVVVYFVVKYIEPILDMLMEIITLKFSDVGTKIKINTQSQGVEFERKYMTEEKQPCIGFHMDEIPQDMEEYDDLKEDDDLVEDEIQSKTTRKIGF